MSVLTHQNYYYHFFGLFISIYLLIFYMVKGALIDPENNDKGQLIPHILLYKTIVLAVYPAYGEMISYCAGFMAPDLPWFNLYFGESLSDPTDATPFPFLLFYISLSLSSTYLLATVAIVFIAFVLGALAYSK